MFKKAFAIILSGILLSTIFGAPSASAKDADSTRQVSAVKAKVQNIGVGERARVEVKMRDDSKVKGYVSAAGEDTFTVTDSKTGAARTLNYADVAKVSKPGSSTRKTIIISAAVAAGVVVAIIFARESLCDGGAQSRGIC